MPIAVTGAKSKRKAGAVKPYRKVTRLLRCCDCGQVTTVVAAASRKFSEVCVCGGALRKVPTGRAPSESKIAAARSLPKLGLP